MKSFFQSLLWPLVKSFILDRVSPEQVSYYVEDIIAAARQAVKKSDTTVDDEALESLLRAVDRKVLAQEASTWIHRFLRLL